jgi:hypothetical protein
MNRALAQRLIVLAERIGNRCPACRDWPAVWILTELSPSPPDRCGACGRAGVPIIRLVGIDPAEV